MNYHDKVYHFAIRVPQYIICRITDGNTFLTKLWEMQLIFISRPWHEWCDELTTTRMALVSSPKMMMILVIGRIGIVAIPLVITQTQLT